MKIGVYADPHITKNMKSLQDRWEVTAMKSIHSMYDKFDEESVESVVCLGDFFDAPRIEAKHMQLVLPILRHINERTYPTYLLLGNHEIDSEDSNILDFLTMYENIIPVTTLTEIENMLFIPYNQDPTEGIEYTSDHIVFTHHDIYGSELAGGKTTAFFGINPDIFEEAKLVMNGHVHLKSSVRYNVKNAGSLLVSQQGELRLGDYPSYYILDTRSGAIQDISNEHSMIYLSIDEKETDKVLRYDQAHLVLRVEYEGEIPEMFINTAHTSWKKKVTSIGEKEEAGVRASNFDMKNYLTDYIKKDIEVSDNKKSDYIDTGLELISP